MALRPIRIPKAADEPTRDFDTIRMGTIVNVTDDGRPMVRFDGGPGEPVIARVATADPGPTDGEPAAKIAVLLVLENGNPALPVIVGFVRDRLAARAPDARVEIAGDRGRSFELNGKALVFEGQEEIVLRCGQGSLTIRANGQIIVKGTRLVSKASETNKIRGASVLIN